jgi:hypothetical protein
MVPFFPIAAAASWTLAGVIFGLRPPFRPRARAVARGATESSADARDLMTGVTRSPITGQSLLGTSGARRPQPVCKQSRRGMFS